MRHVFIHWSQISKRLSSSNKVALFLDFDGTLARIQRRPEEVVLDGSARLALRALARSPRFHVSIISGRRQADIRARIGVRGIQYLGLQGWEGHGKALGEDTRRRLPALLSRLRACLAGIPGLWIEDKEFAFAVHYREMALPDIPRARAIVEAIAGPCGDRFRIEQGKKVWEVLPRELEDKGTAVKRQLAMLGNHAIAVYLGDDQVDEPAFAALRHGITIRVGSPRRTRALYRLGSVAEVRRFLHKLRTDFA